MRNRILLSCVVGAALLPVPARVIAQGAGQEATRISPVDAVRSLTPRAAFNCPNGGRVLIDQQPNLVSGIFGDSDCGLCGTGEQSVAEDFVLGAATTVSQLVFWGGYFPGNQIPTPPDAFDVIFHQDTAGLPGAVIDSQEVDPTSATQTGATLFDVDEILYVLDLDPVALPAGTFWVEIFTDSAGNSDSFFWETGNLDAVNGRDGTAFAQQTPGVTWMATAAQNFALVLCGPSADLSVTKVADPAVVGPGDPVTYTITVANAGPDDAPDTVVVDAFPAELIDVSWTCSATAGSSCTAMGMGDIDDLADILAGGSVTYTVMATVDPSFRGSISNTATITPGPGVEDPTSDDQSSTALVEVVFTVLEIPTLGQLGIALLALGLAGAALLSLRRGRPTPCPNSETS